MAFEVMASVDRVRIGALSGHDSAAFRLAKSSGLYEREGLDVEWVDLRREGTSDIETDKLDLCVCSLESALHHIRQPKSNLVLAGTYIASKRTKGIYSTKATDEAFGDRCAVFPITCKGESSHLLASIKAKDLGLEHDPKFQECGSVGAVLEAMDYASKHNEEPFVVVWDKYAAQPHVSAGKWHAIGEVMTSWSALVFVAHRRVVQSKRWQVLEKFLEVSRRAVIQMCSSPARTIEHVCQNFGLSESDAKHWLLSTSFSCQPITSSEDLHACKEQLRQLDNWRLSLCTAPRSAHHRDVSQMDTSFCADGCRQVQTGAELAALALFHSQHDAAIKLFSTPCSTKTSESAKNDKLGPLVDLMSTTVGDEDLMSVETSTMAAGPQNEEASNALSSISMMQVPNVDGDVCRSSLSYNKVARPRVKTSSLSSPYLRQDARQDPDPRNIFRQDRINKKAGQMKIADHHFGLDDASSPVEDDLCSNPRRTVHNKRGGSHALADFKGTRARTRITDHHFGPEEAEAERQLKAEADFHLSFAPSWAANLLGGLLCLDSDSTMNLLWGQDQ